VDKQNLTAVELQVLLSMVGDVERQLVLLTGAYHGLSFNGDELLTLRRIAGLLTELDVTVRLLRREWYKRVGRGQESNRSVTGGADAAGAARPGDDVPPSTTR
jgi:hypothetical protein